ncbi:N-acyl homoserine lactonase family protein [Sutterella sp.]|uniref:N-acyl homoserine lactonase family protein n=1 Tax=Sutterella sp. TaxID=1981025 RepID=UPI0026DF4551|nr:N-acyl homoserine lactonase family protein [Sutterella sp.]MDO5532827.1 N-acyl homoserine lactonase family protein [Sutterella sp.]
MIRIHTIHTGDVRVSPYLPFGGDDCGVLKAAGLTTPKRDWIWLPVFCYFIEHPHGRILVDTGWHREMSPDGVYDRAAQIRSLGSLPLYLTNQGRVGPGEAIDERLAKLGVTPEMLDYVLLTHLDCDHANGLRLVGDAKKILVSAEELAAAGKRSFVDRVRYCSDWWRGVNLETFAWNGAEGPAGHSFDLFGDGSVVLVHIPGHSEGQCAVRIRAGDGRFVILTGDGGYGEKSWREGVTSGVSFDKAAQKKSLAWHTEQSRDPQCVEMLATHDAAVKPHVTEL